MVERPIQLNLPSELYERIRRIADDADRSVEEVLVDSLGLLFGETESLDTDVLQVFTDQQLWAVVNQRLTPPEETRLRELMEQNKQGALSEPDRHELEALIGEVNRQMLLRSESLRLLKQRGQDIESYRKSWPR